MTGLGIQAWALLLGGLRMAFWHSSVMELLEVLRVLANAYRLASPTGSSDVVYGRFAAGFCKTVIAGAVCNAASRSMRAN
jgi:hypothetical protein